MNNKIIYIGFAIVLIIGTIVTVSAIRQPNDYYAFVNGFSDFHSDPVNETEMDISYPVRYIPLVASATYTFTLTYETTHIDLNQPSTIQSRMRQDITDDAIRRGYNLKKVIIPDYNIMPPLAP